MSNSSDIANPFAVTGLEASGPANWDWDEQVYERVRVRVDVDDLAFSQPVDGRPDKLAPAAPARIGRRDESAVSLQLTAWVGEIRTRNARALAALHDACAERVYAQALRLVQRPCLAEEVVGDCFWQVWREAEFFDAARGSVMAWLMMITRSRAIDLVRRQATASNHELPMEETLTVEPRCAGPGPFEIVERAQRTRYVSGLLSLLEPVQRQLLCLAYFDGLTQREIACRCAMPLGTVKSHLRRGLACLQAHCGGASAAE